MTWTAPSNFAPDDSVALADRGETLRRMGRFDEALADFDRAVELDPTDDWAFADRGDTVGPWNAMTRPWPTTAGPSSSIPPSLGFRTPW